MRLTDGSNIVQAGNNNGGGLNRNVSILGSYFGNRAAMRNRKELITHQANENIRRDEEGAKNKAIYGAVGKGAESLLGNNALIDFSNKTYEKYPKGHPKAGQYVHPEIARLSPERTPGALGTSFSSTAGVNAAEARNKNLGEPSNNDVSKIRGGQGFEGYTPRKTGTGGYDEALKSGAIDKETYDSYLSEKDKPGKNYMPKMESNAVDDLVKERQSAESRTSHFDVGSKEHSANVNDAWGEGKLSTEEASDLSAPGSDHKKMYDDFNNGSYGNPEIDKKMGREEIFNAHKEAGLNDKEGTEY